MLVTSDKTLIITLFEGQKTITRNFQTKMVNNNKIKEKNSQDLSWRVFRWSSSFMFVAASFALLSFVIFLVFAAGYGMGYQEKEIESLKEKLNTQPQVQSPEEIEMMEVLIYLNNWIKENCSNENSVLFANIFNDGFYCYKSDNNKSWLGQVDKYG